MGKAIMSAVVSLDGCIADDRDGVGPLFDWYGNGDVAWGFDGSDSIHSTQASADFMREQYPDIGVVVIGRRLFDLTNGWGGDGRRPRRADAVREPVEDRAGATG